MLNLKTLLKKLHKDNKQKEYAKQEEYPKICPFCGERKYIAKDWARFPNRILERGKKKTQFPESLRLVDLTTEAEQEWYDFIVCLSCYRIIWHQLDPHGGSEKDISLPTLQELTDWQELPHSPVILYDKEGNPVYGTKRSKEMYRQLQ